MELNKLQVFALLIVLVGMVVGIGVLVLDKLATSPALWTTETVTNESLTWPNNGTNVSLDNGNLTAFTKLADIAGTAYASGNYSVDTTLGRLTALSNTTGIATGDTVYAYYSYSERNRPSTQAFVAARDALAEIATSWLSLIVLIGALSVVLVMVIRSFSGSRMRSR